MADTLLRIRKVADSNSPHVVVNDPLSGTTKVINTDTGREESRPLAGVRPEGDLPETCTVGQGFIQRAVAEGWASYVNERVVFRPSGPADRKWDAAFPPHVFIHADAIIFHFMDGDVRYDVTHQPDKYVASEREYKGETVNTYPDFDLDNEKVTDEHYAAGNTRVDHFYGLRANGL